ncbi:hypothetical protein BOX15_Mlig027976g4 [Macrostomum lignano]|uniref:Pre-mRNA-splicing factor Syf1/CRNKL1-like C-terminal HAT-repeats domain-containing protein n=1 Tax=Macrostomum lignano TaxID=282301 RepID=A0A267ERU8_9PLAT|nr:hypothetical protein BOX15_Mlig027976g4 [Macrostomum lignano]
MDFDDTEELGSGARGRQAKLAKSMKAKNKMANQVQITAEQLLREAKERELEVQAAPPKQKISSMAELRDFQLRKRKEYEDNIRKNRTSLHNWIKYAAFEEDQGELFKARSVYERALDVDYRSPSLWIKYAEMEMKHKQVNHARNIFDRAVSILPRVNQFWYKYAYMEEMLGNVAGARQVFERFMEWEPDEQAWHSYINFELRYKELDRARYIYERFVLVHPEPKNWIKYAKFEERNGYLASARQVFERGVEFYGNENPDARLLIEFARFEERQKEHERARFIYRFALDNLPKSEQADIYKAYTVHEKKYGDRGAIESVVISKRRIKYEAELEDNPLNYDAWFDYIRLAEEELASTGQVDDVRRIYERAIACLPPLEEKQHWRRYIYLWIYYALFEELVAGDIPRTREVYQTCLTVLPHKKFTFAKIWLLFAKFEIRQRDVTAARRLLGQALGRCPKERLFRGYIELEIQLREFDRCRRLYEKFLEFSPENCQTWMRFAEFETVLGDLDRARAIYRLAVGQPRLDLPELLWKGFIDFEIEAEEFAKARSLYRELLERTQHVKVWLSFASFEEAHGDGADAARQIYSEADAAMRFGRDPQQRLTLLEAWLEFEKRQAGGDDPDAVDRDPRVRRVAGLMPERATRRRRTDDGGWEEFEELLFPDEQQQPNLRLLSLARRWRRRQQGDGVDLDDDDDDDDEQAEGEDADDDVEEDSDDEEDDTQSPPRPAAGGVDADSP